MNTPPDLAAGKSRYEVGVAVVPLGQGLSVGSDPRQGRAGESISGYEDLLGTRRGILIEKGKEAVNAAVEALASQIATSAEHIATAISDRVGTTEPSGAMELESVDVSFGITLAAGLQAIFTAQADSSAHVTITLRRRAENQSTGAS